MGGTATGADVAIPIAKTPSKFLGVGIESWVKICVGLIVSILLGTTGWVLHVRDSIKERPTTKVVDEKISAAAVASEKDMKPANEKIADHKELLEAHSREIKALELSNAVNVEIHRSQKELSKAQGVKLDDIQKSINKVLYRQSKGDP